MSTDDPTQRIEPKYRPAFERLSVRDRRALFAYFFPAKSKKKFLSPTCPRIAKSYRPFACQSHLPGGRQSGEILRPLFSPSLLGRKSTKSRLGNDENDYLRRS